MNWVSNQQLPANTTSTANRILRFCVVLGTVVYLVFASANALSVLNSAHDQGDATFLIQAVGGETGAFGGGRSGLTLESVVLDGRLLRWESAITKNNWEVVDRGTLPPYLFYSGGSSPALLTFQGKHFLAVFQSTDWTGVFRVKRNGTDVEALALRNPAGRQGQIVLESQATPPSATIFVVALVLFAGCGYWFGPIRSGRSGLPWLIFFLSVVHIIFWAGQCIGTTNDSPGYVEAVPWFFIEGRPNYFPPGYPALLGLLGTISADKLGLWATLTQHGMVVLAAVWIYLLLRRIAPSGVALMGGVLAGASAPSLTMAQTIMSETATLFAMVGALYFTVRSSETGRLRFAVFAGLLTGWAGTLRVVPLAALFPAICAIHFLPPAKRGLKIAVTTLVVTLGFLALPISWCWYKSGKPALTDSVGFHLFNRVVTEQKLLDEDAPATKVLIDFLGGKIPTGASHWEIREHARFQKLDYFHQERLFREVALEGIRKDPLQFLGYTGDLAWRVLMADPSGWVPSWGKTIQRVSRLETSPLLTFTAISLNWRLVSEEIHKIIWPTLCWLAVAGIVLALPLSQRKLVLALAWVPIGYLLSSASVEYFNPRFNAAIVPFVAALAMVPIASVPRVFEFCRSVARQRTPRVTEFQLTPSEDR